MIVPLLTFVVLCFSSVDGCQVHGRNAWWGAVTEAPHELVKKIRDFNNGSLLDPSSFVKFQVDYGYGEAEQIVFVGLMDTRDVHCFVIDQKDERLGKIEERDIAGCREILESCSLYGPFPKNMMELLGSSANL